MDLIVWLWFLSIDVVKTRCCITKVGFHFWTAIMPKNEGALFFLVVILCSTDSVYCLASWCRDQWQGFSLDEDYNPNSPPTKEFILYDAHVLHKVDEVFFINHLVATSY